MDATTIRPTRATSAAADNSSWHGTRVSGIIGARTNNNIGVAGITWNGYILPVRVIGRCGGFNSDVIAGIRWAAGLAGAGALPTNPYPAQVINISLGSEGACDQASAAAVSAATAAGVAGGRGRRQRRRSGGFTRELPRRDGRFSACAMRARRSASAVSARRSRSARPAETA